MTLQKPNRTLADYLVIGVSPVLVMLLVGSLCFFLIEVFFKGPTVGHVRWVMFWFVMAIVLVARIGIEEGTGRAAVFGLALAAATWLYLIQIHPAFVLGMILLGVVWWCAHKLTWDCTLIDETVDASGNGLLETAGNAKNFLRQKVKLKKSRSSKTESKPPPVKPHAPGLWVVYFSVAALPLFGLGQMLLPKDDAAARHAGFGFLFVYVAAALGLLLTTSFTGLRRYLRQRYLEMPAMMAFGWVRFGVGVAVFVLVGALLLPRPGANEAWQTLRYQVDSHLRQASDYAARFNPHGKGRGRSGHETDKTEPPKNPTGDAQPQADSGKAPGSDQGQGKSDKQPDATPTSSPPTEQFYRWFKILFLLAVAALAGWWLFIKRFLIFQILQSLITGIKNFFQNLFNFSSSRPEPSPVANQRPAKRRRFASYRNPFLMGKETTWTQEELVIYSFEALQVWAEEHGVEPRPEQTAREFCQELNQRYPEIDSELSQLSFLYSHAAFGTSAPATYNLEPVKKIWRYLSAS